MLEYDRIDGGASVKVRGVRVAARGAALVPLASLMLALALLALLTLPPSATAQGTTNNPFNPGLPAAPSTTPTVTTPTASTPTTSAATGTGLSSGDAVAIAVGALLVLGGISFFIWRDARRRAPVRRRAAVATAGDGSRSGSKPRTKPRKLSPAERRRRKRGRAR